MNLEQKLNEDFDKQAKDIKKTNIMVVGGTGVGKSSLINMVFGEKVVKVGAGQPVTRGVNKIEHNDLPINIFDTEGYEIINGKEDNSNFEKEVVSEIERRRKLDLKEQIHIFWYCLSVANHRVTVYDIENIKRLNKLGLSLAIVFTQCDTDEVDSNDNGLTALAFKKELKSHGIKNLCFETMTIGDDHLQIDELLEWSAESLNDDDLRAAFIGSQKLNISLKDSEAMKAIGFATAAAAGAAGINPIPMSDSVAIVPIQMTLAVRLAKIYGFNSLGEHVMTLLKTQVVSLVGRQMAASLTKLIPAVGQIINAGVAGAITGGLGYALQSIYRSAYIKYLEDGKEPDWMDLFAHLDLFSSIKNQFS